MLKFFVMPPRTSMINKFLLFTSAFLFCSIVSFAHAEEKLMNDKMSLALKKFNPRFETWKPTDYSPVVQKDAIENKRLPYALILDINKDKKSDIILDGHDDKNTLIIGILSNSKGYNVIVIRQGDLLVPQKLEHWSEGKKEYGLNYYLWPNTEGTGFTLAYPQVVDINGELSGDGAMVEYIFKDGKFEEHVETL